MINRENEMQIRNVLTNLEVREEAEDLYLEGYFITYGKETELWPGFFEEIAQGAVDKYLTNDIRALTNHDSTLVLGRNTNKTVEFKSDSYGLWGSVKINKKDTDAQNTYQRVKRGDVSGNSFGGYFVTERYENRPDGTTKVIVEEIDLREVSVCTFPQYEDTSIQARQKQVEQHRRSQLEQRKLKLKERLNKC